MMTINRKEGSGPLFYCLNEAASFAGATVRQAVRKASAHIALGTFFNSI